MIFIRSHIKIPLKEIRFNYLRSSGPGGQHANKVETAVELRFDIRSSTLPDIIKSQLLVAADRRISKNGVIVIKVQKFRSRWQNKKEAIKRLKALIEPFTYRKKKRIKTNPSSISVEKRLVGKKQKSQKKELRKKVRV